MTLTVSSFAQAMGNRAGVDYASLFPAANQCLIDCGCTTIPRAAVWFGELGEESGGLTWMREIASGAEYEGRANLGNTQPGDGVRFAGRGPIQVTGRHNYTVLSQWAFDQGYVPTPTFFVDNPVQLELPEYGFMGVTWYWTTQQPRINEFADVGNIEDASKAINCPAFIGNPDIRANGIQDRIDRWQAALAMGDAILPNGDGVPMIERPVFNEDNQIGTYANFSTRFGQVVDLLIIHTEEPFIGQPQDGAAQRLANVTKASEGTKNPVSYHYAIGQNRDGSVDVIDIVDTDYECWAVLDSNPDSINYCFAESSVALTTQQWMDWFGNAIDVAAYLIVQDARKYDVPLTFLFPSPTNTNVYPGPPPGITDHKYVTEFLGDGSHTDVGPNFPWTYFGQRISYYAGTSTDPLEILMTDPTNQEKLDFIFDEMNKTGPLRSFLDPDGALRETMLGFVYNASGDTFSVLETLAYLADVPSAVANVEQVASGGPVPASWAAGVPGVSRFGQDYCVALVTFKTKMYALLDAVPATVAAGNSIPSTPSE